MIIKSCNVFLYSIFVNVYIFLIMNNLILLTSLILICYFINQFYFIYSYIMKIKLALYFQIMKISNDLFKYKNDSIIKIE